MSGSTVAWSFVGVCLLAGSLVSLSGNGRDTSAPKHPSEYGVVLKDYSIASGHHWVVKYMCDDPYYSTKGYSVVVSTSERVRNRAKALGHPLTYKGGIPYFLQPEIGKYMGEVKDAAMTNREACDVSRDAIDELYTKYGG